MDAPFKYKSKQEVLQAGKEKNEHLTWLDEHASQIIAVHNKIKHKQPLAGREIRLLDVVLNTVVCNIMHDKAETEFYCIGG